MAELTKIKPDVTYNIVVKTPTGGPPLYTISYNGAPPPSVVYYEEAPIEPIPSSLPVLPPSNQSYQNSNNEGVEGLLSGRNCGNCVFYEAESGNCGRWNALVRNYYWCISWKTMEPVIAQPNAFTQFIEETNNPEDELYNFFSTIIDQPPSPPEPNLTNFLTPLDALHSVYNAYLYGDSLRRMLSASNAFDFDNTPLDLFFTTQDGFLNAIDFINDGGLNEFEIPIDQYDSVQQHLCTYTLSKKTNSTLPAEYPQTIILNLHGSYFGEPKNILSQLDFTNAKVAINPKVNGLKNILVDNRYSRTEFNRIIHIDILRDSVRERILKFFGENTLHYKLDGQSCFKFIQWVGDRSYNSESMQELYNFLLSKVTINSNDQNLREKIENTLGVHLIDNPPSIQLPISGFGGDE